VATGRVHSNGADPKSLAIAPPSAVEWPAKQSDKVHMGTIGLCGHPQFLQSSDALVVQNPEESGSA
jgi:hypothetical protein